MGRRRLPFVPNAYPWIFSLSALASLLWLGWMRAPAAGARRVSRLDAARNRFDAGAVALAGGLAGARLGYAAWHLAYFLAHPSDFLFFWQGGLDWFGGLLGAGLGLVAFSRAARQPLLPLADSLALPGMVLSAAAWAGCWVDACAYGRATAAGWWAPAAPDSFGVISPRWPTQAAGVLFTAAACWGLVRAQHAPLADGVRACLAVASVAAIILILSPFRGDASPDLLGLRGDALGALLLLGSALGLARTMARVPSAS